MRSNISYRPYANVDYEKIYKKVVEMDPSMEEFIDEVREIELPEDEEIQQLEAGLRKKDKKATERLIELYTRYAVRLGLQRAEEHEMNIIDAISEAHIGLVVAANNYNIDRCGIFEEYAHTYIISRFDRNQETTRKTMHYPAGPKGNYFKVYRKLRDNGYKPEKLKESEKKEAFELLRKETNLSVEEIEIAMDAMIPEESMEQYFAENYIEESNCYTNDVPEEFITEMEEVEKEIDIHKAAEALDQVMDTLAPREKEILRLRYGLTDGKEYTLEEVSQKFGVTKERIRQIEAKALRKLRHPVRGRILHKYIE